VAFFTQSSNLSPADPDSKWDVFIRNLGTASSPGSGSSAATSSSGTSALAVPSPGGKGGSELTLGGKGRQSIRAGAISFTAQCDEACSLEASASVSVPTASKVFRLREVKRSLPAGKRATLKLKLSKKAVRAAKRAIRKRKRVIATVKARVANSARNASTARLKVRLTR
jgi:hypothetical protein